jgi:peptidoglycan-associated lipoprotein
MTFSCKSVKLSVAEEKQRIGEYYEAAAVYRKLYSKTKSKEKDKRAYIAYRMGLCNRKINNIPRAISAYMLALRYDYPDSLLYLRIAQTMHAAGRYTEAMKYYSEFLNTNPSSQLALNGIKGCEVVDSLRKNPNLYQVKKADVFNSRYSEFSPMFGKDDDELYFVSSRAKKVNKDSLSHVTGLLTNDFYVSKKNEKGAWMPPEKLEDAINTTYDEGTPSFSKDGSKIYYTYCENDSMATKPSEIYISTRGGAAWNTGQKADIINDSLVNIGHPSVSPDGKYLYFVADANTYGGKDIFRTRIKGMNDFAGMENLGSEINSEGDEMFPYVRDSVTLYFASDGHPGIGGLDLFKATFDEANGKWNVENMGIPVNSSGDDFGITFEKNRERGFFSSNRNDTRGYDHIYSIEKPAVTISIEGYVSDAEEYPLDSALIRIVGKDGLNEKVFAKPDGSYKIELERDISYVMMAGAPGYLNQNIELKTDPEEKNETYYVDFYLSPIHKPTVVENIFYDFDKATLRPESKEALEGIIKILNDNPNITIEIGAHTDRKGAVKYNEGLGERRAQAVVDYLVAANIPHDRLAAKGYGKTMPKIVTGKMAAENNFLNEGDILNEEFILNLMLEQQEIADQYNRRTEFIVTGMNYNFY